MTKSDTSQLDEFKKLFKETNGLFVLSISGGIVAAIGADYADLSPPWPDNSAIYVSLAQIIVFMYVFMSYRTSSLAKARRVFVQSFLISITFLVLYLIIASIFIVETRAGVRIVGGFQCKAEIMEIDRFARKCPFLDRDDLMDHENDVFAFWTRLSITTMRILIFVSWTAFISGLMLSASVFTLYAMRRPSS